MICSSRVRYVGLVSNPAVQVSTYGPFAKVTPGFPATSPRSCRTVYEVESTVMPSPSVITSVAESIGVYRRNRLVQGSYARNDCASSYHVTDSCVSDLPTDIS